MGATVYAVNADKPQIRRADSGVYVSDAKSHEAATAFLKAKCWSRETYNRPSHNEDADVDMIRARKAPLWRSKLRNLVENSNFNALCFLAITLNVFAMIAKLEITGAEASVAV